MIRNTLVSTLAVGLCLVAPRLAHADDCALDTDCQGAQVCLDQVCADSEEPADTCESDADCHVGACTDGFCKRAGVRCEADDGSRCEVYPSSFECLCANGEGFGGAGGSPGPDPLPAPDPDQLYGECLDNLTMCDGIGDGDGDDDDGDEPDVPPHNEDPDEGGDDDAEPGGDADEEVGDDLIDGRGCSTASQRGSHGGWALAALALLGLRRRRRECRRWERAQGRRSSWRARSHVE